MATTQSINIGDSNRTQVRYDEEATFGTIQSSVVYTEIAVISDSLSEEQPTVDSELIDAGRRVKDIILTDLSAPGDIVTELVLEDFDDWWEALAMATRTAQSDLSTVEITVAASGNQTTYSRSAGSFITDGWVVNDWVVPLDTNEFTNEVNNEPRKISIVAATLLTTNGRLGTAETTTVTLTRMSDLTDADVFRSYSIEKEWTQFSNRFLISSGQAVNGAALTAQLGNKIGLTFSFIGSLEDHVTSSAASSSNAISGNRVVDVPSGAKLFMEGGVSANRLVSVGLNFANGLYPIKEGGVLGPIAIGFGQKTVGGTYETYVSANQGLQLLDKFHDRTESAVAYMFKDPHGNWIGFDVPKTRYTNMKANIAGGNQAQLISAEWRGKEATEGSAQLLYRILGFTAA